MALEGITIIEFPQNAIYIWVDVGSSYGLLTDVSNSLPEQIWIYHQRGPVAFNVDRFHRKYVRYQLLKWVPKYTSKSTSILLRVNENTPRSEHIWMLGRIAFQMNFLERLTSFQYRDRFSSYVFPLLIPQPVASEHRWLVKAPRWIHSVPDISDRRSWRRGCHARLWDLHDVSNASRL